MKIGSVISVLDFIKEEDSNSIGFKKGARLVCTSIDPLPYLMFFAGFTSDNTFFSEWALAHDTLRKLEMRNSIKIYPPPFDDGIFPDGFQIGDIIRASKIIYEIKSSKKEWSASDLYDQYDVSVKGYPKIQSLLVTKNYEEFTSNASFLIDGPTFNEKFGIVSMTKLDPANNDGRLTCFWCGASTKQVQLLTTLGNVCTKCGR